MKKAQSKKKNIKHKKDEWEGFDDCAICKAMKNGKGNNLEDLMKAFEEVEKSGVGKVGFGNTDDHQMPQMTMRTADKDDLYYDSQDALEVQDFESAKKFLNEALDLDPEYVQTYIGFINLYGLTREKEKARENIKIAFEKTLAKFPKWPKKMLWGHLENRAYLRAIQWQAELYQDVGDKEKAIELYKLLLKLNSDDNQGVRYVLAGLYAGMNGEEINRMFDDGNEKQNWDKLEKLVDMQNRKYNFWKKSKKY